MKNAFLAVLLVIVGLLVYAASKPDSFSVSRSVVINAPSDKIFATISNHHKWEGWSPWDKLDPAMKRNFTGPESGVGAVYEWDGNDQVGAGRNEITAAVPNSKITMKLDMLRPFEAHNVVDFTLEPAEGGTKVTWAMSGPSPYIAKVMWVVMGLFGKSCEEMVGGQFDEGLASLKGLMEKKS